MNKRTAILSLALALLIAPILVSAQTITPISPWYFANATTAQPLSSSVNIKITSLAGVGTRCLQVSANGTLSASASGCGGSGSATTTINGVDGPNFTLTATSSGATLGWSGQQLTIPQNISFFTNDSSYATSGDVSLKADKSTTITASTGLTGGGDLSANRSISLNINGGAAQTCTGTDKVSALSATGIVTCTADTGGGGGITSLNGSTSSTQVFATTTAASGFNITTLNGVHTFSVADTATLASSTWLKVANNLSDLNNAATARDNLGVEIGVDVQAYSANLTTYAGITPSANVQTLLGAADYAAFKTSLSLNNVENTALSTWPGTSNITTLGTISTGVWNGTDIAYANIAQGSALSVLGVAGNAGADNASIAAGSDHQVLRRSGTSIGFGQLNLSSANAVTGTLPAANVAAAGSDTQVQFNNGGSFAGDDGLVFASTSNKLGLGGTGTPTNLLSVATAPTGSICDNALNFANPGTGYSLGDVLTVSGGTNGKLMITAVQGGGGIDDYDILSCGYDYVAGTNVSLSGGTGSGALTDITPSSEYSLVLDSDVSGSYYSTISGRETLDNFGKGISILGSYSLFDGSAVSSQGGSIYMQSGRAYATSSANGIGAGFSIDGGGYFDSLGDKSISGGGVSFTGGDAYSPLPASSYVNGISGGSVNFSAGSVESSDISAGAAGIELSGGYIDQSLSVGGSAGLFAGSAVYTGGNVSISPGDADEAISTSTGGFVTIREANGGATSTRGRVRFESASQTGGEWATWNLDNLTASRDFSFPDITGTLALLEGTQTFSGAKTFSATTTAANITVTDSAYASSWNGLTQVPTKNAVYDQMEYLSQTDPIKAFAYLGSTIKATTLGDPNGTPNTSGTALVDQRVLFVPIYIGKTTTLTGIKWWQVSQGSYTADQTNQVGLYSYSGGTMTLIASSTNDGNLWKAGSSSLGSKAFAATYNAAPGIYFAGLVFNASATTTTPSIGNTNGYTNFTTASDVMDFTNSAKLFSILTGQNSLPSSITMASTTATTVIPWVAVY